MAGANALSDHVSQVLGGGQPQQSPIHTGSLEPLAMLRAYRAGQPVINPHFQRPAQFLPQGLESYTPPAQPIAQSPFGTGLGGGNGLYGPQYSGGPAGGADADGGAAAAAASAAADASADGGGGGGGGAK
jgi:hypothetical protein